MKRKTVSASKLPRDGADDDDKNQSNASNIEMIWAAIVRTHDTGFLSVDSNNNNLVCTPTILDMEDKNKSETNSERNCNNDNNDDSMIDFGVRHDDGSPQALVFYDDNDRHS